MDDLFSSDSSSPILVSKNRTIQILRSHGKPDAITITRTISRGNVLFSLFLNAYALMYAGLITDIHRSRDYSLGYRILQRRFVKVT